MPTYCTAQEVANFLRIPAAAPMDGNVHENAVLVIGADTDPSQAQVEELIEQNESWLEARLRHAWRTTVASKEIHDITRNWQRSLGYPVNLVHRDLRDIDTGEGDKVEIWDGSDYRDTESGEWTLNTEQGVLYMRGLAFYGTRHRVRVTYRYGSSPVPLWLKRLTVKATAIDLLETSLSQSKITIQLGYNPQKTVDQWRADIDRIVADQQEFTMVGY